MCAQFSLEANFRNYNNTYNKSKLNVDTKQHNSASAVTRNQKKSLEHIKPSNLLTSKRCLNHIACLYFSISLHYTVQ